MFLLTAENLKREMVLQKSLSAPVILEDPEHDAYQDHPGPLKLPRPDPLVAPFQRHRGLCSGSHSPWDQVSSAALGFPGEG